MATESSVAQTDALVERLFTAAIGTLETASVDIGGRLGFYRALADMGEATPTDLAARTGTAERYVRDSTRSARHGSRSQRAAASSCRRARGRAVHRPGRRARAVQLRLGPCSTASRSG